jgi:hypothetical protein
MAYPPIAKVMCWLEQTIIGRHFNQITWGWFCVNPSPDALLDDKWEVTNLYRYPVMEHDTNVACFIKADGWFLVVGWQCS